MIAYLKRFSSKRNSSVATPEPKDSFACSDSQALSAEDLKDAVAAVESAASSAPQVWIEPDSELTSSQSLLSKRKLEAESFIIGRRGAGYISSTQPLPDFALPQNEPFTVSKRHCEISVYSNRVVVRDLGSRYGIIVNGNALGGRQPKHMELELDAGEHTLVVGPRNSSYRFRLIVE